MGLKPFTSFCYHKECERKGEHLFINPHKVRNLESVAGDEVLIVRFECTSCHRTQDFVMTLLDALEVGLKYA
jgi:hypothetical protein